LKKLAHCLVYPLSAIFTSFMSVGHVPQAWKWATVTPVFKGGIASDPSNYIIIYLLKSTEQEDAHMINTRTRAGQERHRKLALTFCP